MDQSDPGTLLALRDRLEREHARVLRSVEALERQNEALLVRAAERDPCAYLSPAAALEAAEQKAGSELRHRGEQTLVEIESALERLEQDPVGFFQCARCGGAIASERLDILPQTRLCADCASSGG